MQQKYTYNITFFLLYFLEGGFFDWNVLFLKYNNMIILKNPFRISERKF